MIRVLRFSARALMLAGAVGLAACGDDGGGGGGGGGNTTTFTGIVSNLNGSGSGSISFVVETANLAPPAPTGPSLRDPVNVTGSVDFGGGPIALTGDYDPDLDALGATGGGYTFAGFYDGVNRLEGGWDGPAASNGTFVTTDATGAVAYCGTYDADDASDSGTFSFVVAGNLLLGERASDQGGGPIPLDGTVSSNNITIFHPGTSNTLAVGTISGNNVSGTFDDQGFTGTWSGSVCP